MEQYKNALVSETEVQDLYDFKCLIKLGINPEDRVELESLSEKEWEDAYAEYNKNIGERTRLVIIKCEW